MCASSISACLRLVVEVRVGRGILESVVGDIDQIIGYFDVRRYPDVEVMAL